MKRSTASLVTAIWIFLVCPAPLYSETTAYFPNFGNDNVYRAFANDESNFTPVDLIDCDGPYGAAVTPDGTNLLITCTTNNSVIIVPTANFENSGAQSRISLGNEREPRGIAIESRGLLAYVANYESDTVSEINISTGQVTEVFEVGDGPWGVAAFYDTADASIKVYVTNNIDDSVSVISNDGVETIRNVGDGPLGAALTPDGDFLYVASFNNERVVVIDTSDQSISDTIFVGNEPWGVAMASDGDHVFVTNSIDDNVSVINTSTGDAPRTGRVGDRPLGVAAPINGDFAYVVNQGDNTISKVSTDRTVETINEGEFNGAFSLGAFIGGSPPEIPTGLEATAEASNVISIKWTDNADDEIGYRIERREDEEGEEFIEVATVDADETSFTDNGLQRGRTYEYRLRAFNEVAFSDYSATASATTNDEPFSWCFIHTLLKD